MQSDRELMQQALETLEYVHEGANNQGPHTGISWRCASNKVEPAITALRERLAQPEQEPQHDYRTRYDRGCYKCGSHYCPADCPEPTHLVLQQPNTIANSEAIPEQISEPVAMRYDFDGYGYRYIDSGSGSNWQTRIKDAEPLYTTPPRREWVGLTDDDLKPVCDEYRILFGGWVHDFARAIEAKLKEKNSAD